MRKRFLSLALLGATVYFLASSAVAENWPRFRGPNAAGTAAENGVPAVWSDKDIAWQIDLPGKGHSSPVIWDDTVFVTFANEAGTNRSLRALRASDGTLVWQKDYALNPVKMHSLNSHASSTPAVDDRGVYALWFGTEQTLVTAVDHAGEELWTRKLGPTVQFHGASVSPAVYGDMLVFSLEQMENKDGRKGYWYGLNRSNGKTAWRLERNSKSISSSSSVPLLYKAEDGSESLVFSSVAHGLTAVDLKTGEIVWAMDSALPKRAVSSPVQAGNLIVATCGVGGGPMELVAVEPPTSGTPKGRVAYTLSGRAAPYVPSPLAVNGWLFLFGDGGQISCLDGQTGDVVWSERLRNKFFGSPVLIGDRIYCIDRKGKVVVVRAGDAYELLGVNDLGEASHATPAVSNGRMVLRTQSRLICIAGAGAAHGSR